MDHVVVAVLIAVATANLKLVMGIVRAGVARLDYWEPATPILATGSATAEVYVRASGSATADASVMAPSPFAVKLSVGAVGAVEAVGGGGALSQEVVMWVKVLGGGAVGGGAAACSPTVSQKEEDVGGQCSRWCGRGGVPAPTPLTRRRGAPSPQPRVGLSRT